MAKQRTQKAVHPRLKPSPEMELVVSFLLLTFVVTLSLNKIYSNDTWWHTEIGRWMVENRKIFTNEIYSVTAAGRPFLAYSWLTEIIFYLVQGRGGVGLTLLKVGLMVGGTLFLYFKLFRKVWDEWFAFPIAIPLIYMLCFQSEVRPQLFGLWCGAGFLVCLEYWWRSRSLKNLLYFLPVHVIWTNLHGSYLLAIFLVFYLAGFLWIWPRIAKIKVRLTDGQRSIEPTSKLFPKDVQHMLGFGALLVACSMINPQGINLFARSFEIFFTAGWIKVYIREWQSIAASGPGTYPLGYWAYVWMLWIAASWLAFWKGSRGFRSVQKIDLALLLAGTAFPFMGTRHLTLSVLLCLPGLLRSLTAEYADQTPKKGGGPLPWSLRFGVALFLVVTTGIIGNPQGPNEILAPGLGFAYEVVPMDIIQHVKVHNLKGIMMNDYDEGAYVIYYLYPNVRTVMDSRTDTYGKQLFEEHHEAYDNFEKYKQYVEKYDANLVLVRINNRGLREHMFKEPGWFLEKSGLTHDLFRRVDGGYKDPLLPAVKSPMQNETDSGIGIGTNSFCLLARMFGQCVRIDYGKGKFRPPECESICGETDQELINRFGISTPECLRYSQSCFKSEFACGRCGEFCQYYQWGFKQFRQEFGIQIPDPPSCRQ